MYRYVYLHPGKNDVVGENFCLRTDIGRSKGTVRALTYCDLLALSREDLMDVIRLYPEFKDHFARKVEVTVDMRDVSVLLLMVERFRDKTTKYSNSEDKLCCQFLVKGRGLACEQQKTSNLIGF